MSIAIFTGTILVSIVGSAAYPVDPLKMVGPPEQPPSQKFPLSTDSWGRDLLALLLQGIKNSFYIGVTAAAIALAIGLTISIISGFKGDLTDSF